MTKSRLKKQLHREWSLIISWSPTIIYSWMKQSLITHPIVNWLIRTHTHYSISLHLPAFPTSFLTYHITICAWALAFTTSYQSEDIVLVRSQLHFKGWALIITRQRILAVHREASYKRLWTGKRMSQSLLSVGPINNNQCAKLINSEITLLYRNVFHAVQ